MSFLGKGISLAPAFTELAGGLLGGALNSAYQRSMIKAQVAAMKDLWSFQQQNAHQYEVQDLRNAGLNPILSATNSQLASMPGVSTPTSAPYSGLGNGLGNTLNTAMKISIDKDLKLKDQELKLTDQEIQNRGLDLEQKKIDLMDAKNKAEISKIENDISIALEDLEIRKQLKDMTVEERHAMIEKLYEDAGVSRVMADKIGLEYEELKRKMRYGTFLMTYLPSDVRDYLAKNMVKFIKEHPEIIDKFGSVMDPETGSVPAGYLDDVIGRIRHLQAEFYHRQKLDYGVPSHGR